MKQKCHILRGIALPLVLAIGALPHWSSAQSSFTWNGGGGDNFWTTGGNWGGTAPGSLQNFLNFAGTTRLNNTNNFSAGSGGYQIYFKSGAGAFTLNGNSISFFDFGGTDPNIQNEGTTSQTINFPFLDGNTHGANGIININLNTGTAQGPLVFNGTITANDANIATRAINVSGTNSVTFNGVISDFSTSGKIALTQLGSGTTLLAATNTYSGDTAVNTGTVRLSANNGLANSTIRLGATSGSAGANLNLDGGKTLNSLINVRTGSSGAKIIANTSGTTGPATFSGNLFLDADVTLFANGTGGNVLSGSTLDLKNQTLTLDGAGTNLINGPLTNSTGSGKLAKNGAGTLTLSASNSFSGAVTLNAGIIRMANSSALGSGSKTISSTLRTTGLEVDGGVTIPATISFKLSNDGTTGATVPYALRSVTGVNTIAGAITMTSGGGFPIVSVDAGSTLNLNGTITNDQARTLILQGAGTGVINGVLSDWTGVSSLQVNSGDWTLAGANTYSGYTTNAGSLTVGNGATSGTLGSGGVTNNGTLTFNRSDALTVVNVISGTGTLTQGGTGSLTLSGANTYSGNTTISSGTLKLAGSISGGGTTTVAAGATLTGGGTHTGPVVLNGVLAPGSSVGALSTGPQTWNGGASYVCEVINATNLPGVGFDSVNISGGINLQATSGNPFIIKLLSLNGGGAAGAVTNFNNNTNYIWTIAATTGSVTNFNPTAFAIDNSSFSNDLAGGQFVIQSGSLRVVFTNNHPSVASDATYGRAKGVSLKIKISDLAANWSDPDGDGTAMIGIDATSTNGASITTNATEIFYTPANDVSDLFTYTIRDLRSYRAGDTVRTAVGRVFITVSNSIGLVQNVIPGPTTATVNFAGIPGYGYVVQRSTNLVDWVDRLTTNAPSNGLFQFVDDFSDIGGPPPPSQAYYRLRTP